MRYSRAGGIVEAVDMEQAIRQAADGLNPELQSAATLDVDPSVRATGAVRGPRVEIQQIVGNLILNAAESIRSQRVAGGRIGVRAVREEANGAAVAHLIFEDNGAGIQAAAPRTDLRAPLLDQAERLGSRSALERQRRGGSGRPAVRGEPGRGQGASLHLILPLAEDRSGASERRGSRVSI